MAAGARARQVELGGPERNRGGVPRRPGVTGEAAVKAEPPASCQRKQRRNKQVPKGGHDLACRGHPSFHRVYKKTKAMTASAMPSTSAKSRPPKRTRKVRSWRWTAEYSAPDSPK